MVPTLQNHEVCHLNKIRYNLFPSNIKVEYHANAKYENSLKNSEKIACVGQRLMYPIMKNSNTLPG